MTHISASIAGTIREIGRAAFVRDIEETRDMCTREAWYDLPRQLPDGCVLNETTLAQLHRVMRTCADRKVAAMRADMCGLEAALALRAGEERDALDATVQKLRVGIEAAAADVYRELDAAEEQRVAWLKNQPEEAP